jgi:hypothetical protein
MSTHKSRLGADGVLHDAGNAMPIVFDHAIRILVKPALDADTAAMVEREVNFREMCRLIPHYGRLGR